MTLPPHIELRARCAGADDISGIIFACRSPLAPRTHTASSSPRRWRPHSTRSKRDRDAVHRSLGHGAHGLQRLPAGSERSRDYPPYPRSFRQHIDDVLAWPLLSYEKTRWKSRREWFDYMGSCRNDEFTFGGVSIRLPETMLLYVSLRPTVAPQAA